MASYKHELKRRPWKQWYGTQRWKQMRARHKARHPLCVMCLRVGVTKPVDVVDHIKEHKGDASLFWNENNLQSLCYHHHNSDKQAFEKSGIERKTIGLDGYPID